MTEEKKIDKKKCGGKGKAMFAYGLIQLGSNVVSAVALAAIALSFCSVKKEAMTFNDCVEEMKANGKSSSSAVSFCNGGKWKMLNRVLWTMAKQNHQNKCTNSLLV